MRRFLTLLGVALLGCALLPALAQAQIYQAQYGPPPIIYGPPVVSSYYVAPSIPVYGAPVTYSYYPPTARVYSYYPPAPVVTYSAPPVYTYSAPVTYAAPGGVIQTRTYYGYGIFRPRGYYTESRYYP